MTDPRPQRPLRAALAAGAVALIPWVWTVAGGMQAWPGGAASPSLGTGLRVMPLALALMLPAALAAHVVGCLLLRLGLKRLGSFVAVALAVSALLAFALAASALGGDDVSGAEAAASGAMALGLGALSSVPAAAVWWWLAVRPAAR